MAQCLGPKQIQRLDQLPVQESHIGKKHKGFGGEEKCAIIRSIGY